MKKLIMVAVIAALAASTFVGIAFAQVAETGNGAPSGAHYNLNLIGVLDKSADMTGSNGHVIFVDLTGKTRILLAQGPAGIFDFQVLDANGTDGTARFQLPNPDPDNTGTTWYSVYARALGKPGGHGNITSGFVDADGNEWFSVYSYLPVRSTGKSSFTNVTKELLYVYVDMDLDGTVERVPLFDDRGEDYFWDYDNQGLKLVQLRFYEVSTTVP
jgi:hypothetical protein